MNITLSWDLRAGIDNRDAVLQYSTIPENKFGVQVIVFCAVIHVWRKGRGGVVKKAGQEPISLMPTYIWHELRIFYDYFIFFNFCIILLYTIIINSLQSMAWRGNLPVT